jgi:hypothetical protein
MRLRNDPAGSVIDIRLTSGRAIKVRLREQI